MLAHVSKIVPDQLIARAVFLGGNIKYSPGGGGG